MFEDKIYKIFEAQQVSQYLTLQRTELDDQTFMKLLGLKPGEINIVISRVVSIIKNDGGEKSRGQLFNDCLEVLERSGVARKFVGLGLNEEYKLFKGFPVRRGDPYENMPNVGGELVLQPEKAVIGWCTDATKAREQGALYDSAKGEPIGGLLVEAHVDSTKIIFDVNAVIRTCKAKMVLINQYNVQCAPGKSLSKSNVQFLASQAPTYHEEYEVLTNNTVVNTRVADKWTWDNKDGNKVVKWIGTEQPAQNQSQPTQGETAQQEHLREIFESAPLKQKSETSLDIHSYHLEEGFMDNMRIIGNWINKTAAITVRGKTMKYLELLLKQYTFQKQIYELAIEYTDKIDDDSRRSDYANDQISRVDEIIQDIQNALQNIQQNPNDGLTFIKPEEQDLSEELQGVFNESTLGIFDRVADAVVHVKDRVTHKQLDTIFKKLIKAMENHYHYRMKALEMQRELLVSDYKNYKGTRFESLPTVQKLKTMIEYTNENIRLVQEMRAQFEKDKLDAANFSFTGKSAPQNGQEEQPPAEKSPEEKTQTIALDKQEDELDNAADAMVKKADAATQEVKQIKTAEPSVVAPPEEQPASVDTNPPTSDETNDVNDVIGSIEKGFAASAQKERPHIPKGFSDEAKNNIEKQMRLRKSVWFNKEKTAQAFSKVNPGWSIDNPMPNVFRVSPPVEGANKTPETQEINTPEVIKKKVIRPTKAPKVVANKPQPVPREEEPPFVTPELAPEQPVAPPIETPVTPQAQETPVAAPEPETAPESPVVPSVAPEALQTAPEPISTTPQEEPLRPAAEKPPELVKRPEIKPISPKPQAKKIVPANKDSIRPSDSVMSADDISKMPAKRREHFINYMNALSDVTQGQENIKNAQDKLKAFPNSQVFKNSLRDAQTKLTNDTNRLNIFKNDLDLRAHISDENTPVAYEAYKQWLANKQNQTPKVIKPAGLNKKGKEKAEKFKNAIDVINKSRTPENK
jgi:hypothetical protein